VAFLEGMELVEQYRGFQVCLTTPGHLVVIDSRDSKQWRTELVVRLAGNRVLDALFFSNLAEARDTIDRLIATGIVGPMCDGSGRT
jgi:hypothetical protein